MPSSEWSATDSVPPSAVQSQAANPATGSDELFAVLQGNIGYLPGRGLHLIGRSWRKRIDLNGIDVAILRAGCTRAAALAFAMILNSFISHAAAW
jgi:hypothetical protein